MTELLKSDTPAVRFVKTMLKYNGIVMFSKTTSPECIICKRHILREPMVTEDNFKVVELELRQDCCQIENYLLIVTGRSRREVPAIFVSGVYVGGYTELIRAVMEGRMEEFVENLLKPPPPKKTEVPDVRVTFASANKEVSPISVRIVADFDQLTKCRDRGDGIEEQRQENMKAIVTPLNPTLPPEFKSTNARKATGFPKTLRIRSSVVVGDEEEVLGRIDEMGTMKPCKEPKAAKNYKYSTGSSVKAAARFSSRTTEILPLEDEEESEPEVDLGTITHLEKLSKKRAKRIVSIVQVGKQFKLKIF